MLPFSERIFDKFESQQFNFKCEFDISNPLEIVTNKAALENNNVVTILLDSNGDFDRGFYINELAKDPFKQVQMIQSSIKEQQPIKVEGMETYNNKIHSMCELLSFLAKQPVNCHFFWGREGKGSFGWHQDECHVWCYMISGTKTMHTETGEHELNAGDWLFMPEGLRHMALNKTDTMMLSFGTSKFWASEGSYLL